MELDMVEITTIFINFGKTDLHQSKFFAITDQNGEIGVEINAGQGSHEEVEKMLLLLHKLHFPCYNPSLTSNPNGLNIASVHVMNNMHSYHHRISEQLNFPFGKNSSDKHLVKTAKLSLFK